MSTVNKAINRVRNYRLAIREWLSTRYMFLFCRLYGVRLGAGCRFWDRAVFYKEVGSTIQFGDGCVFRSDLESNLIGVNRACIVSTHSNHATISIGNGCGFSGASIGIKDSLQMGDNVQVGANSYITDFDWHAMDPADRDNPDLISASGVKIEDNVWLGLNCVVLKGVTIGANSIIGAGSVVTKDVPVNSICAGNPCRVLRTIEPPIEVTSQIGLGEQMGARNK